MLLAHGLHKQFILPLAQSCTFLKDLAYTTYYGENTFCFTKVECWTTSMQAFYSNSPSRCNYYLPSAAVGKYLRTINLHISLSHIGEEHRPRHLLHDKDTGDLLVLVRLNRRGNKRTI
jgi:hypothetical protein